MPQVQFKNEFIDSREFPRFEPLLDVEIKSVDCKKSVDAKVLDVSRSGMAVVVKGENPFQNNNKVNLTVEKNELGRIVLEGGGSIVRRWDKSRFGGIFKGFAVKFTNPIDKTERKYDEYFFDGVRQKARIANQEEIAKADMNYLGNHRQKLIDGQQKLFILTLTITVTLASAYFALYYHSVATNNTSNKDLNFWRAMIACIPGLLAIACTFMSLHKSIAIHQIDSYLSLLKERIISFKYPREYHGWETEIRKFRHILKTDRCKKCWIEPKCGSFSEGDKDTCEMEIFKYLFAEFDYFIIYFTFLAVYILSIFTFLKELLQNHWGSLTYMLAAAFITFFSGLFLLFFGKIYRKLIKGEYSFDRFKRCWADILSKCRETV